VVIVQELVTWLLADHDALTETTGTSISEIHGVLEEIHDPKQRLQKILSEAGVVYAAEVARKIAAASDLARVAYHCPSFQTFHRAVSTR
jgi:hypothetical protein